MVAGFQGMTESGDITTLGRGGSDLTGVALAAALKADVCEIFTDVDGVYTADPNVVPDARKLARVSYDEMLEMAALGAVLPLLVIQHPLGGEKPESVSRRALQAVEQLASLLGSG